MDITKHRRARLKEWFSKNPIPVREKSYISQLISGKASFGEKAARRLESDYGMPEKYLDDNQATTPAPITKTDTIEIPRLNANGSMGAGLMQANHEEVIEKMTVNAPWLRRNVSFSSPSNLALISAYGDSMEGTFDDGDILLVDRGVNDIRIDAVYVLSLNDELYIKRLQRRPDGSVLMISDNKKYEPYLIENGERNKFSVLGRVLLAWNARKL